MERFGDSENGNAQTVESIMSQRSARFLKLFGERSVGVAMELRLPSPGEADELPNGIENPFVITTLIAGVAGVTLSIIIILSIWILKNPSKKSPMVGRSQRSNVEKGPIRVSHITIPLNDFKSPHQLAGPIVPTSLANPTFQPPPPPVDQFQQKHITLLLKIPKETPV